MESPERSQVADDDPGPRVHLAHLVFAERLGLGAGNDDLLKIIREPLVTALRI